MLEFFYQFDLRLLHLLNTGCPTLDQFWLTITQLHKLHVVQYALAPAALLVLFYIYRVGALKLLLMVGLAVALSDLFCYRVLKSWVHRPRPFQNQEISSWLRHVGDAHGWSFPSNHASNCFAAAGVLAWYFRRRRYFFYSFAVLVGLSRPALGVHYPSDVVAGAMLGLFVAWLIKTLLLQRFVWLRLGPGVSALDGESGPGRSRTRRHS